MARNDETDSTGDSADIIPFELLKLDRAVAARLEEVLDFVPDSKRLVKEAFRRLRSGDREAFEEVDGEIREYLEAELLRLIQSDPALREIVTTALMREAEASILEDRSSLSDGDLTAGESEAVHAFRASLERSDLDAIYGFMTRGAAASQRGEDRFASSLFNEAIALAPDYFEAYLLRGVNHSRNERFASALKDAETSLQLCPDSARAVELQASSLRSLGRDDEAMSCLSAAIARLPEVVGLRVMRGAAYVRREAFRDAVKDLDVAVRQGAGPIAYILRGEARLGVDAFASAQKDFDAALLLDSDHPRALGGLIQALARRRKWTELAEGCSRLIDVVGPDPEALAQRAHARLEQGKTFAALLDGLAALTVQEHAMAKRWADSAVARLGLEPETNANDLAVALENAELLESHGYSASDFLTQVDRHARAETFAVTLARAIRARENGSPEQVSRLARRAAGLPGATIDATFVLAGAALEAGDLASARAAVQEIVERGVGGSLTWTTADAVLIAASAIEESEGAAAAAEYLSGMDASYGISREMGRLRAELGDEDGARRALRAAVEMNPKDPSTLFENARFEVEHDPEVALDFLEQLVDVAPHYGWALSGEAAFGHLREMERFVQIVGNTSTLATAIQLESSYEEVCRHADSGWVWRWLGRKSVGKHRLVAWELPERAATAFYIDDAVSMVRALVFYGEDAAAAAEATRRELPGSMIWSVEEVSADPNEALRQLRLVGWAAGQGLTPRRSFDEVVLECLRHPDPHIRWRAASASAQSDWSEVNSELRKLAHSADDDRVREEALFSLQESDGRKLPLRHHDRWETFHAIGERDEIERYLWKAGLTFVGEQEPDERAGFEIMWATGDGETVVAYTEDELHDVRLISFAGDADALVKGLADVITLRSLEDAVAKARETQTPSDVSAVAALLPEESEDFVVEFVRELQVSDDPSLRGAWREQFAGRRAWLPASESAKEEATRSRYVLLPTVLPESVSATAARLGWSWKDAAVTSDTEHPASRVAWAAGSAIVELHLHRFGFWFFEVLSGDDELHATIEQEFAHHDEATLLRRTVHPDASVRADAAHYLGILGKVGASEAMQEHLAKLLVDPSLEVRTHALEAVCIGAELRQLRTSVANRAEAEEDPDLKDYAAVLLEALSPE